MKLILQHSGSENFESRAKFEFNGFESLPSKLRKRKSQHSNLFPSFVSGSKVGGGAEQVRGIRIGQRLGLLRWRHQQELGIDRLWWRHRHRLRLTGKVFRRRENSGPDFFGLVSGNRFRRKTFRRRRFFAARVRCVGLRIGVWNWKR